MNKLLLDYLSSASSTLSLERICMNFGVACVLGLCIFVSYRLSHSGAVYSPRFNVSLLMLAVITTMVMNVIGNNIALSLGMVGALSIIRFRTAIKDPRDAVYIFWCIGIGICCGVSEYHVPAIGSGVLFILMLVMGVISSNDRYLLIIHADAASESSVERTVHNLYEGKAILRVKNSSTVTVELIYELSRSIMRKLPDQKSLNTVLLEVNGVSQVNLVMQSEEVAR